MPKISLPTENTVKSMRVNAKKASCKDLNKMNQVFERNLACVNSMKHVASPDPGTNRYLKLKRPIQELIHNLPGTFEFLCKTCTDATEAAGEGLASHKLKKHPHRPKCSKGHSMEDRANKVFYFIPEEGTPVSMERNIKLDAPATQARATVRNLENNGFTKEEIVQQSRKCMQSWRVTKNRIESMEESTREGITSGYNQSFCRRAAKVPLVNVEDIVAGHEREIKLLVDYSQRAEDDMDEEVDVNEGIGGDDYYNVEDRETLLSYLEHEPYVYKHCTIHLEGCQAGKCTTLDGDEVIETRGRMNCGAAFEGDEVVVKIMETSELDKDTTVTRGKVVGVLKRQTNRKAHIFVCRVDPYHSNLMIPLCGTFPKIHVVDSNIREHYGEKKNDYVDVYRFKGGLGLKKVVKIDTTKKKQLLFVVKYLKWEPSEIYPLGYVFSVMPAGLDMVQRTESPQPDV